MSQMPPKSRVSGGIPWWLWLMMISFTGIVILNTANKLVPEDPEKLFQDAVASYEQRNQQPIGQLIARLAEFPEYSSHVELLKGFEQLTLSRPLKAVPLFEKAAQDPKTELRALQGLADLYARVGELPKAAGLLEKLLGQQPDNARARNLYCMILDQMAAYGPLIDALKIHIEQGSTRSDAETNARLGEAYMVLERFDDAAAAFEVALKEESIARTRSDLLLKLVRCLQKSGQAEKSLTFADQIEAPSQRESLRGLALLALGRQTEAAEAARKIETEAGNDVEQQTLRAKLASLSDLEGAREVEAQLEPLLLTIPRNIGFYEVMRELASKTGKADVAGVFEENIRLLSGLRDEYRTLRDQMISGYSDAPGRLRAGDLAAEIGETVQADKWYRSAEAIDPSRKNEVRRKIEELFVTKSPLVQLNRINLLNFEKEIQQIIAGARELE